MKDLIMTAKCVCNLSSHNTSQCYTFTHMPITHAICFAAALHDRCLLLHLPLLKVWMLPWYVKFLVSKKHFSQK